LIKETKATPNENFALARLHTSIALSSRGLSGGTTGSSSRSVMRAGTDEQFVQQVAAEIPWFHSCALLDQVKNREEREWYIRQTMENGRSRNVLVGQALAQFLRKANRPGPDRPRSLLLLT
jgi:hypothetical protein